MGEEIPRKDTEEIPRLDMEEIQRVVTEESPRMDTVEIPQVDTEEIPRVATEETPRVARQESMEEAVTSREQGKSTGIFRRDTNTTALTSIGKEVNLSNLRIKLKFALSFNYRVPIVVACSTHKLF